MATWLAVMTVSCRPATAIPGIRQPPPESPLPARVGRNVPQVDVPALRIPLPATAPRSSSDSAPSGPTAVPAAVVPAAVVPAAVVPAAVVPAAVVPADASTAAPAGNLTPEAVKFVRGIVLLLLPQTFEDSHDWGAEKRIQSGLNVRLDGFRIDTNRRWNSVNHGMWRRASGTLIEPEKNFQMQVALRPSEDLNVSRYVLDAQARIGVTAQQQQWNYGVMLWSVSADAVADVSLHLELDVSREFVQRDDGTRLRILPAVTIAAAQLDGFRITRISHVRGTIARELGQSILPLVQRQVEKENRKLAERINARIRKKADRLEIPMDFLSWGLPPASAVPAAVPASGDASTAAPEVGISTDK